MSKRVSKPSPRLSWPTAFVIMGLGLFVFNEIFRFVTPRKQSLTSTNDSKMLESLSRVSDRTDSHLSGLRDLRNQIKDVELQVELKIGHVAALQSEVKKLEKQIDQYRQVTSILMGQQGKKELPVPVGLNDQISVIEREFKNSKVRVQRSILGDGTPALKLQGEIFQKDGIYIRGSGLKAIERMASLVKSLNLRKIFLVPAQGESLLLSEERALVVKNHLRSLVGDIEVKTASNMYPQTDIISQSSELWFPLGQVTNVALEQYREPGVR